MTGGGEGAPIMVHSRGRMAMVVSPRIFDGACRVFSDQATDIACACTNRENEALRGVRRAAGRVSCVLLNTKNHA